MSTTTIIGYIILRFIRWKYIQQSIYPIAFPNVDIKGFIVETSLVPFVYELTMKTAW